MKKLFFVGFSVLLVACAPVSTAVSPTLTRTPSPTISITKIEASSTALPLPSNTKTTVASSKTPTPSPTSAACLHLIRPANGASLSKSGNVEFAWESQRGAQLYVLSIVSPAGTREDARVTTTRLARSIKATSKTGSYYWRVSAYDAEGDFICNSGFNTFSREAGGRRDSGPTEIVPPEPPPTDDIVPPEP